MNHVRHSAESSCSVHGVTTMHKTYSNSLRDAPKTRSRDDLPTMKYRGSQPIAMQKGAQCDKKQMYQLEWEVATSAQTVREMAIV